MHGVRVVVDPFSAPYLVGSEIDFVDALMGAGFAINNPNVQARLRLRLLLPGEGRGGRRAGRRARRRQRLRRRLLSLSAAFAARR